MTAGRARRALELSAQPGQIFAAGQNDGGRDEAGGCSQVDAEKGATGLSATSAWIVRVLWPMMVARLRLIRAIVQGTSTFIVDPIALLNPLREPRTVPDIRAWPCLSRRLVRLHPKAMLTSDGRSHDGRAAAIRFVQTRRPRWLLAQ